MSQNKRKEFKINVHRHFCRWCRVWMPNNPTVYYYKLIRQLLNMKVVNHIKRKVQNLYYKNKLLNNIKKLKKRELFRL